MPFGEGLDKQSREGLDKYSGAQDPNHTDGRTARMTQIIQLIREAIALVALVAPWLTRLH